MPAQWKSRQNSDRILLYSYFIQLSYLRYFERFFPPGTNLSSDQKERKKMFFSKEKIMNHERTLLVKNGED